MLDKYTRGSLLQTMLGIDDCNSEFNMLHRAHSLARAGDVAGYNARIEMVIDSMGDTWTEDELLEYVDIIYSPTFSRIRTMLGKLKENYDKRVSDAIALTDNPEGMNRA